MCSVLWRPVDHPAFKDVVTSDSIRGGKFITNGISEFAVLSTHGLPFFVDGPLDTGLRSGECIVSIHVAAFKVLDIPLVAERDIAGGGVTEEPLFPSVPLPNFRHWDADAVCACVWVPVDEAIDKLRALTHSVRVC